jgi:Flp pilus assembly protein TadD
MTTPTSLRWLAPAVLALTITTLPARSAAAQGGPGGGNSAEARRAAELDSQGRTAEARAIYQAMADSATNPGGRASALRGMAMSYAFDNDCANAMKYEIMVIAYWMTREEAEPQNAFYQQGEMANEGARVCIEAGDLDAAERWYRVGYELGMKEPEPKTHPASLWQYRMAHALGRIAARRGNASEAWRHVADARRILDGDSAMAAQQERFFPYLAGYVALYTNDLASAERILTEAVAMRGNQRDPFMRYLLALTYERQGRQEQANATYREAYELAGGHNPPAAFVRPFVRKKLGIAESS